MTYALNISEEFSINILKTSMITYVLYNIAQKLFDLKLYFDIYVLQITMLFCLAHHFNYIIMRLGSAKQEIVTNLQNNCEGINTKICFKNIESIVAECERNMINKVYNLFLQAELEN